LAQDRIGANRSELFAVLPPGSPGPEGLTVGPDGNVYVTTFGFNKDGAVSGPGHLIVFRRDGQLVRDVLVAGSSSNLVGLAFNPISGDLLVLDFPNRAALKVDPMTGASSVFMTAPGNAFLNGLTFDRAGNVYVSDSIQGTIWKAGLHGGPAVAWVSDPLLTSTGFPPFGANGVEFNNAGDTLFVANTGNSAIIKIPVVNGAAGKPVVFVNGALTPDGIAIDRHDNIWFASNQGDEIVTLDPSGRVIARSGGFQGITGDGIPHGLLFPASLSFSLDGDVLYVTNLALDVRFFGLGQAADSPWAAQVKSYTVSKVRLRRASSEGDK
jgi:sugar lactone lactonase YvrE